MSNSKELTVDALKREIALREKELFSKIMHDCNVDNTIYGVWNYFKYLDSDWYSEQHRKDLKLIAVGFGFVELGIIKNIAISVRTRAGKTRAVNDFVTYSISRNRTKSIIRASHSESLVSGSSSRIKETMLSEKYQRLFGVTRFKRDRNRILDWAIVEANESTYKCAGVDGGLTGSGANNLIIGDDLIKDFVQAYSISYLTKLQKFLDGVFDVRKERGCKEIQIGTRWTKNDVIGQKTKYNRTILFDAYDRPLTDSSIEDFIGEVYAMNDRGDIDDDTWVYILIPALNKNNKSNCEWLYPTDRLLLKRKELFAKGSADIWNATYQQKPEKTGLRPYAIVNFKKYNKQDISKLQFDYKIASIDASGEGSNNTCCSVYGIIEGEDNTTKAYLIDLVYTNNGITESKVEVVNAIIRNKVSVILGETNGLGEIFLVDINEMLKNRNYVGYDLMEYTSNTNKEAKLLANADWVKSTILLPKEWCNLIGVPDIPDNLKDIGRAMNDLNEYVAKVKNQTDDLPDTMVALREWIGDPITFD